MRKSWWETGLLLLLSLFPIALVYVPAAAGFFMGNPGLDSLWFYLPYFWFLLTAALALRMGQWRMTLAVLVWATGYALLARSFGISPEWLDRLGPPARVAEFVGTWTVGSWFVLFLFQERGGVLRRVGMLVSLGAVALGTVALYRGAFPYANVLLNWRPSDVAPWLSRVWLLHFVVLIPVILFVSLVRVVKERSAATFLQGLALSLLPLGWALNHFDSMNSPAASLHIALPFNFMGLVLLYGATKVLWQRIYYDDLTQVLNRRALNEALPKLKGGNYAIAMIDVDRFKEFNDTYGHEEGDNVLRFVASFLRQHLEIRVYRFGGEEFCLLFPEAKSAEIARKLDDVRRRMSERPFGIRSSSLVRAKTTAKDRGKSRVHRKVKITISIGLAAKRRTQVSASEVLASADRALYQAKGQGRNCLAIA
ncbi:MAG: diguanylate cyclase [Bacteriovoracia bacterium]